MKKIFIPVLCGICTFMLSGCGNDAAALDRTAGQAVTVSDVLEAGVKDEKEAADDVVTAEPETDGTVSDCDGGEAYDTVKQDETSKGEKNAAAVDLDLTVLSSTMVYSEVYNMMISPEDYVGKRIKMEGIFSIYYDEVSEKNYFACIIMDATACCSQGIEFEPSDEYSYPEDFPEAGSFVCVEGVFDTYMEGENMYCTLRDAELISWTAGSIEEVR